MQAPGLGLALLDRELRFRFVNASLMTLSGIPGSAYDGRSPAEVWPGVTATLAPLLNRVLQGETVLGTTVSGNLSGAPGQGVRHFRVSLLPANPGGTRSSVALMFEDETERVEQERQTRESEARLRGLVNVACDGYIINDPHGTVLEVDAALARLLGSTPAEMMSQPITKWIAPESRESVQRAVARQVEAPYEATALRSDGKRVHLEVLGQTVEYHGRAARMVAVWDISARKAAEEAAARADTFREQLLGVVGHDLRAPLYTLQLSTAALERGGGLSETQARQVAHVATATQRMDQMIRELLDFTRARLAGGIPVRATPLALEPLLTRAVEDFRLTHPTRRILTHLEGELRGTWDEARLRQLVDNLVGNALQHSPADTAVELKVCGSVEGITLSVRNEGAAVPLEERATLFEPFTRGKRAQGDGLGLGLYIARQIALAHGGRISVESGVGVGTRFIAWLPLHAPGT